MSSPAFFPCSPLPADSLRARRTCAALGAMVLLAFWLLTHHFWVRAQGGVDQNAYLVAGKAMAHIHSPSVSAISAATGAADPQLFIGAMWVQGQSAGAGRYYPKYPLGFSLLVATAMRIAGSAGTAYFISPICMVMALAVVYLLAESLLGCASAVIVLIWMATCPVTLALTNSADCHALDLLCTQAGVLFAVQWWKHGGRGSAIMAGLALGFAAICRYTEALFLLPLLVAVFSKLAAVPSRQTAKRESAFLLIAWGFPIVVMLLFNRWTIGAYTGYAHTNENSAFALTYFTDNWLTVLHQSNDFGLFFLLPLAALGAIQWAAANRRMGLFLTLWAVPSLLLYTCYYWAPEAPDGSYMRFFLPIFPPALLCAGFLLKYACGNRRSRWVSTILVTFLSSSCGIASALPILQRQRTDNLALARLGAEAVGSRKKAGVIPEGSVVFAQPWPLNYLQFVSDDCMYNMNLFNATTLNKWRDLDALAPQGFDPRRAAGLVLALGQKSDDELLSDEQRIIWKSLATRKVFFICSPAAVRALEGRLNQNLPTGAPRLAVTIVDQWDVETARAPRQSSGPRPEFRRQSVPLPTVSSEDFRCICEVTRAR